MEKIQKGLFTAIIAGESIHIFCCFLPSLISIANLMTSVGVAVTLPGFIDDFHHMIHDYEIPMIFMSGILLLVGWIVYIYASRLDCSEEESCCHGACAPRKNKSKYIMIIATIFFIFNVSIYMTVHYKAESHDHSHDTHIIEETNGNHDHEDHHH